MSNQLVPILLNLVAAILGAFGQYSYKKGGLRLGEISIWLNFHLWFGVLLFCGVMILFVIGYKMGGRISVVYPFYASTFIWSTLIGYFLEKEPINLSIIGGSGLIILGLTWISHGLSGAS